MDHTAYTIVMLKLLLNSVSFDQTHENDGYFLQLISNVDQTDLNYLCVNILLLCTWTTIVNIWTKVFFSWCADILYILKILRWHTACSKMWIEYCVLQYCWLTLLIYWITFSCLLYKGQSLFHTFLVLWRSDRSVHVRIYVFIMFPSTGLWTLFYILFLLIWLKRDFIQNWITDSMMISVRSCSILPFTVSNTRKAVH